MSDLLSAEEKSALQQPYGAARDASRVVTRAVFPSVSQLDPERAGALHAGIRRWLDGLSRDLSSQLRVACAARLPSQSTVACESVAAAGEETFWGRVEGPPAGYLALSVPADFAAVVCERIFGAPLQPPAARALTAAERMLLRDLARAWLMQVSHAWKGVVIRSCDAPEEKDLNGDGGSPNWLRFSSDLACGPITGAVHLAMTPHTARLLLGEAPASGSALLEPEDLAQRLGEIPIEMRVVLGQTELTVDELTSLQIGDVVALDRRSPDPVDIYLEDRPLCRARAGLAGQRVAFELISGPTEETLE